MSFKCQKSHLDKGSLWQKSVIKLSLAQTFIWHHGGNTTAAGIIIATLVYKVSFSGGLKTLLDLLPKWALDNKEVLLLVNGGSIAHLLAVDYALKPVLDALKAQEILYGVFAEDSQVTDYEHKPQFNHDLKQRLDGLLNLFLQALQRRKISISDLFIRQVITNNEVKITS